MGMEVYVVDVRSWTASFRYPNLISGMQPTLEVPPVSTVLGLINAAAGFLVQHKSFQLGYYFQYEMEGEDLETIYQIKSKDGRPTNEAKSNIISRRFLYNNYLRIYTPEKEIADYFKQPYYPLLLGRMNDLATVSSKPEKKVLNEKEYADKICGQVIPFEYRLPGQIQALPIYFTDDFPRKNVGTRPFSIINHKDYVSGKVPVFTDKLPDGKEVDIYFHSISFEK